MTAQLSDLEARVIGVLMEKSVITPDQYPLTLNALTNGCNQKSARDPVLALEPGMVQRTAHALRDRHLLRVEENYRSGVEKYTQVFCNTRVGGQQFDAAQFAVVTLLLLRGAQTPGELRARSGRLHEFEDNEAVTRTLDSLIERDGGPVVVRLPRIAGRRDNEYMHLFCGEVDTEALAERAAAARAPTPDRNDRVTDLLDRIEALEAEVESLRAAIRERD